MAFDATVTATRAERGRLPQITSGSALNEDQRARQCWHGSHVGISGIVVADCGPHLTDRRQGGRTKRARRRRRPAAHQRLSGTARTCPGWQQHLLGSPSSGGPQVRRRWRRPQAWSLSVQACWAGRPPALPATRHNQARPAARTGGRTERGCPQFRCRPPASARSLSRKGGRWSVAACSTGCRRTGRFEPD